VNLYDGFMLAAAICSIISFIWLFTKEFKKGELAAAFLTVMLAISLSATATLGFFGYQDRLLSRQLTEFQLPNKCKFQFYESGQLCGFVFSVSSVLEQHKSRIPDTYSTITNGHLAICGAPPIDFDETETSLTKYNRKLHERAIMESAAESMCEIVSQLRSE